MTLLALAQTCSKRLLLNSPSSFIGSTSNNNILLLSMIDKAIDEIKEQSLWPELSREHTFTLATSTASYALPGDYDRRISATEWNRTQARPLMGPVSPQDWQMYKSGLITSLPNQRYRVKGWTDAQFFIDPTPGSTENGQTCVYEYMSKTARRPKTWVTATSWVGNSYCSYNGNIYTRGGVGAGTTGTTAPTHTTGAVSDSSLSWTYVSTEFVFTHDTDEVLLDNQIVIDGAIWRFKRERGLDYRALQDDAENILENSKSKLTGASVVSIRNTSSYPPIIDERNYPEGDF